MKSFRLILSGLALLTVVFSQFLFSKDPLKPLRVARPPIIDGKLDDPMWQQAPFVTGFRSFIPDFGKAIPESTVVFMTYDRENLYFAFRCFDPNPELIKAEITNRDNIRPHDFICINLDSFNDQQSLYAFYVNALGIQSDSRFASGNEDFSVDLVWYSAGLIDGEGYTVEVQIPVKSIRYSDKNPVEMSLIFERRISRRSEHVSYPVLDPNRGYQFLTQMQPIIYTDLLPYKLLEILPAATFSRRLVAPSGSLVRDQNKGEVSLTAKYGITSNLVLDGTFNPDFSQIEADAGQVDVNLRYGLFFPEKRPFFLEGSEIFNLAATGNAQIVHTRTIVNPLVGLKLSGKLSRTSTIAAIYAIDELLDPLSKPTREKASFPIIRYKYALEDDGYLGGIYTGRELSNHFNRVIGSDGLVRATTSSYFEFQGLLSQTKLANASLSVDGHSLALTYRSGTRDLDYDLSINKLSRDFSAEAGYVTRTGILSFRGFARPKIYPSSGIFRRIDIDLSSIQTRDDMANLWETSNSLTIRGVLVGALTIQARYIHSTEIFLRQRFGTEGYTISGGGQFTNQFNLSLNYLRTKAIFFSAAPYQGTASRLTANLVYQPWNQFEANLNVTSVDFYRESDGAKIYDYPITRGKLTYQINQYLFFRGILQYNKFRRSLLSDFLASFMYIPGTVFHAGYGSLYQRVRWDGLVYTDDEDFVEITRGFFFKMSYLWRL